ncbi:MAG: ABC transporter permease [Spirochaetales bacterium]|nr:ABC transporter permease [Spirochaetales bacterium]
MKRLMKNKFFFVLLMMGGAYLFSTLLIALFFRPVSAGLETFFLAPFTHRLSLGNWLNRATLYMFSGSAVVLAFQGGEFNLGGEGQICLGGLVTVIFFSFWEPVWALGGMALAFLFSALASGLLSALSGVIKNRTGLSEVITTYLLSMGVVVFSRYFITGPFKDETSYLVTTPPIPEAYRLGEILPPSHLNITFFFALLLIVLLHLFLYHHPGGYEWRLCGINSDFAVYCGIDRRAQRIKTLFSSGALNGFTGSILILGTTHRGIQDFFSGYGWNGIAVSLIGGNNPLLLLPSSLFFSHIAQGTEKMEIIGQFPYPLDGFIMGLVFLVVTSGRLGRD